MTLELALKEIAKQLLPDEMEVEIEAEADYRGAYETIVKTARDALQKKEAPKPSRIITNDKCKHFHFAVKAKVIRHVGMEIVDVDKIDIETSHVTGHTVDLSVVCKDCGLPFRFLGMQAGSHPREPRVSVDATELRAPLEPAYVQEILGQPLIFGKA